LPERVINLCKDLLCGGECFGKGNTHTDALATLAGKLEN
jgi:hypothetical protein